MRLPTLYTAALLSLSLVSPASADDRPFNWTGFYIGAHGGGTWGDTSVTDTNGGVPPGPFKSDGTGWLAGATAGFNTQWGALVVGLEGDLGYMGRLTTGVIPSSNPIYHQDTTVDGGMYADITARVGIALDRTLIYAKGGWAWFDGSGSQVTTKPGYQPTGTGSFSGWTAGGGIEQHLWGGWSLKAEFLHTDFGKQGASQTSVGDDPIGFVYANEFRVKADTAKIGLNYRF